VVAVVVVVALLAATGAGAYWWFFGGGSTNDAASSRPSASPSCRTPKPKLPQPLPRRGQVEVEVLNGTDRSGLATQTADDLVVAGFDVVAYGNADAPVDSVGRVTYAKGDLGSAVVVASYFPGVALKQVDRNTGGVVTVTLGADFDTVATNREAKDNVATVALPTRAPVCD